MKIVHAQTVIEEDKLELLRRMTGKLYVKDAIMCAIDEYIEHRSASAPVPAPVSGQQVKS